ncbi:MAG: glycosyltransferase [Malacoplasma sp.]|nr:glycosyltransferase [Malacoplasma sp.]
MSQNSNKKLYANHFNSKKEKSRYYFIWSLILFLWVGIIAFCYWTSIMLQWENTENTLEPTVVKVFVCFNFIFNSLLYCDSTKQFIYGLYYNFYIKKQLSKEKNEWNKKYQKSNINKANYMVYVLYCTCDDFDENSLLESMKQKYKNCKFFILDDSKTDAYKKRVDDFAKKYKNVQIIRRDSTKGFKAGNINHFLKQDKNYDYFVVLDADEIIPSDFIGKSLLYFLEDDQIGIVQAKNLCTRQKNLFDYIGSYIHNFQWQAEYNTRDRLGVLNLCGHGAIIKKECYEESNGFPEILLEDWGLTYKALRNKFSVVYADNITCYEEFPSEYISFKKRQFRWSQGGAEVFKYLGFKSLFAKKVPFFRKLDIYLSQTSFIIIILSSCLIVFNLSILCPLGFSFTYLDWYIAVTVFFAIAPLTNCFFFYLGKINFFKLILIILFYYFIYSSLLVSTTVAVVSAFLKTKFKFFITPKNKSNNSITFWQAILFNIWEIIISFILLIAMSLISYYTNVSILTFGWIVLIVIPMLLSVVYSLLSNIKITEKNKISMEKDYENPNLFI